MFEKLNKRMPKNIIIAFVSIYKACIAKKILIGIFVTHQTNKKLVTKFRL